MLTPSDQKAIDLLVMLKCATTDFFHGTVWNSLRYTQKRLSELHDYGEFKRERDSVTKQYLYWIPGNKPKNIKHALYLSFLYKELYLLPIEIIKFEGSFQLPTGIRPDGFIYYKYKNRYYANFIEIQISPKRKNDYDINKYQDYFYSGSWKKDYKGIMPRLIIVSNQTFEKPEEFKVIQIKEDFSHISKLL